MDELEQAKAEIKTLQGKIDRLETDNFQAREKRRELEKSVETLQSKVPTDDQVVVKKEEAETLKAYAEIGKPEELKTQLEQAKTATTEAATLRRSQSIRDAAGDQFNAKALERFLPGDAELAQQGEGDDRAWVVKQGDTTKPLADLVKSIEQDVGVSLTVSKPPANVGGGSNPGGNAKPAEPKGLAAAINAHYSE